MNKGFALAALLLVVPAHAAAQSRTIPDAVSVGLTAGVSDSGNSWSGGGPGPQLTGNVEVPLPNGRLRASLGHSRWTPSNRPGSGGEIAGRVGLSRIMATVIAPYIKPTERHPFGMYGGIGVGVYLYDIEHGRASHRTTRGYHALGGVEFLTDDRRRVLRIELEVNAIGGPGHEQVWATAMFGGAASVGISRRF